MRRRYLLGVKWSQVQIAALAAVGLRLADPIPQRLGRTFNCSASRRITGVGSDSRYNRTARSGNSTGYLLFAASKTSFLGLQDQTWFGSLRKNRGTTHRAQLRGFGYSDNDRVDPSDSVPRCQGGEARHGCILRGARVRDHPAKRALKLRAVLAQAPPVLTSPNQGVIRACSGLAHCKTEGPTSRTVRRGRRRRRSGRPPFDI